MLAAAMDAYLLSPLTMHSCGIFLYDLKRLPSINKKVEIADLNFNGDYLICGITYNRLERRYDINARILLKGDKE